MNVIPNYPSPFPLPPSPVVRTVPKPSDLTYRASLASRFWDKVTVTPGCWIWDASTGRSGYGQFWDGQTMQRAHRIALGLYGIEVPADLECDHLCNVRACVNPDHIELVTHAENMRRRFERVGESERARKRRERIESGWWVCI